MAEAIPDPEEEARPKRPRKPRRRYVVVPAEDSDPTGADDAIARWLSSLPETHRK